MKYDDAWAIQKNSSLRIRVIEASKMHKFIVYANGDDDNFFETESSFNVRRGFIRVL